jgi:signal transduction histidine kinase
VLPEQNASRVAPDGPVTRDAARSEAMLAVYEAALVVASDLDLDSLLQRVTDLARTVVPAHYAALGVADAAGRITEFYTSGISPEARAALGPVPQGHGLIGALIDRRETLLVPDIAADPRSVGFPPNHPPMTTLLGVPILHGARAVGNLYLCDRIDGHPFDQENLEAIRVLAAHAASAIDRAQLFLQAEAARLSATEQRDQLRVLVDQLPSAVLIQAAPSGRVELANEVAITMLLGGGSPPGTMPRLDTDFRLLDLDGRPVPPENRLDRRAMRGEVVRNLQLQVERADGSKVGVLAQATPLRSASGQVSRVVMVFQDITRLREADQLKDDFLSLVSHEFRTPLTAIHGGAQVLLRDGESLAPEERRELLNDVAVESDRLDRMLANLLSLAAIMAGRMQAATEPVLLQPLVRAIAVDAERRSPPYRFPVDLPSGLPPVEADPDLLRQVLRNLYENAVKYSTGQGEVRTTAARREDVVHLSVIDQGIGIAAEHVGAVFERFRRPGADPGVRGMGLGLYLSRLLIEAQGGRIWAESAGRGRGATFTIELPIVANGDDPAPGRAAPGRAIGHGVGQDA